MSEKSSFSPRKILPITIVASGTFAWWFFITLYFEDIYNGLGSDQVWVFILAALFYGSGALSTIPGSMIGEKISRKKFLIFCYTFGVLATILLLFVGQNLVLGLFSSTLLGISLGLVFPSCMTVIAHCTKSKERGRYMGTMVLETFVMIFLGVVVLTVFDFGLIGIIAVAVVLRSTSYLGFSVRFNENSKEKGGSWLSIISSRELIFYLLPWFAFNLAGELVHFIWVGLSGDPLITEAFNIGDNVRNALIAFLGPVAGIAADRVGRKYPIIFALVILGVGFAFLGLATSYYSAIFYLIMSGIAWTLLMVSYFALFGDIAKGRSTEKFYALGISTPLLAYALVRGILPILGIESAEATVLSPIMSILLFLSILPVLSVSDTISETDIRERRLKEHAKKIGEIVKESENK